MNRPRNVSRPSPLGIPAILLLAAVWALFTLARSVPCYDGGQEASSSNFADLCYSDIRSLYAARGIAAGIGPFSRERSEIMPMEYPPLSWYVASATGWLTDVVSGEPASSARAADVEDLATQPGVHRETWVYFGINLILLAGAAAGVASTIARFTGSRSRALVWFVAPSLAFAGAINWDLLAVATMAVSLLTWRKQQHVATGVLVGLGAALKLFPALALGVFLILALRERQLLRPFAVCSATAAGVWLALNAPLFLFDRDAWSYFWEMQSQRTADIGSVWQALRIGGIGLDSTLIKLLGYGGFALGCLILLALGLRRHSSPNPADLGFLVVWGFVVSGSVYNPQYGLWMLPLALMSTARIRDVAVWQLGELVFFVGIMSHIGGITPPPEGPDKIYVLTIGLRLLAGGWLAYQLLRSLAAARAGDNTCGSAS